MGQTTVFLICRYKKNSSEQYVICHLVIFFTHNDDKTILIDCPFFVTSNNTCDVSLAFFQFKASRISILKLKNSYYFGIV